MYWSFEDILLSLNDLKNRTKTISSYNNSFLRKWNEILFCFNLGPVQNCLDYRICEPYNDTKHRNRSAIQSLHNIKYKYDCFGCYNFCGSYCIKTVYAAWNNTQKFSGVAFLARVLHCLCNGLRRLLNPQCF